jgi:G3E family GTPase
MFGGFLGAGKTTAMLRFAQWLSEQRDYKVGVITNDQANGLVDSALASSGGRFAVREVGGGCFCCKSETLVEAMGSFSAKIQPQEREEGSKLTIDARQAVEEKDWQAKTAAH